MQNIFYSQKKNIKIIKIIVIMLSLILISVIIRYLLIQNNKIYIPEASRECDKLGLSHEKKIRTINLVI